MKKIIAAVSLLLITFGPVGYYFLKFNKSILPNILLISLDTLRADAVGAYNPSRISSTPFLDKLATDGIRYQYAYAPVPFTLSSHMSMFTGVYPMVHMVEGTNKNPEQVGVKTLPETISTIPQVLKQVGYNTMGLFSSAWLKAGFGFGRGFDHYEQVPHSLNLASLITDKAIDFVRKQKGKEAPFFLFLHYYDDHSDFWNDQPPYASPGPFQIQGYREAASHFCIPPDKCATQFLLETNIQRRELHETDKKILENLYLAGVKYTDAEVGRFIHDLREQKLYDNTLIIITSDHGEEFQEHGSLLHEQTYEECSRVPLIIKFPNSKYAGVVVDNIMELIDIMPTIINFINKQVPVNVQGKSMVPATGNNEHDKQSPPLLQDKIKIGTYATRDGKYKLIYNIDLKEALLFDLVNDPNEEVDIANENPEAVNHLRGIILEKIKINIDIARKISFSAKKGSSNVLGEEEKERLRSLGYTK